MNFCRQQVIGPINRLLTVVSLSLLLLCTTWSSFAFGVEFSSAGWQRLCKRIFTATPSVRAVKGGFKSLSIEGTPEDTRLFAFDAPYLGLEYRSVTGAKMADYDVVTLLGRKFGPEQAMTPAGAQAWPNLMGEDLQVFELAFKGRRFLVISGGGSGLFQSGSYQQVRFFHLFDLTRTKKIHYYRIASRFGDICSFGDRNGDGQLDFVYMATGPDDHEVYGFGFLTFSPSGVSPIQSRNGTPVLIKACMSSKGDWVIARGKKAPDCSKIR